MAAEVEATALSGAVVAGERGVFTAEAASEEEDRDSLVERGISVVVRAAVACKEEERGSLVGGGVGSVVTVTREEANDDGDCRPPTEEMDAKTREEVPRLELVVSSSRVEEEEEGGNEWAGVEDGDIREGEGERARVRRGGGDEGSTVEGSEVSNVEAMVVSLLLETEGARTELILASLGLEG